MSTATQLATGLAGAIGSDFRRSRAQLLFVEFGGKLSSLNLFSTASVISSGSTVLKGTWAFDLENGTQGGVGANFDIWWDQKTAVARDMTPQNGAGIINLGIVDFNSINADSLQKLIYSTTPIPGNNDPSNKLVPGDVFAVRTAQGNFAKVKVLSYGYDLGIQWVTYKLNPAYTVLGTGYQQPEDVKLSVDDAHAYVTERTGNLLRVALNNANRPAAVVVAAGMVAPHQIFLDEANNAAYVVEFAPAGHLWRIDLSNGNKTALVSNLENAVGLVLSADLQFAYVSEQTAGADKGRVSRIQLSNGTRIKLATGLVNPFFLTWENPAQTSLLVPERDPANRITRISLSGAAAQVVAAGVPARPSSVAVIASGDILICSDQIIEELVYAAIAIQPNGPLLMSIGFVPFDKVSPAGLATTDPGSPYFVVNAPFGGSLPVMVNHQRAFNDGTRYYRIKVDGVITSHSAWSDYKWDGLHFVLTSTVPVSIAGQPGYYPVHPISELFLWVNPSLGGFIDSTALSNGLHNITVEFVNAAGALVETSTPLTIMVNNQRCLAGIEVPTINNVGAEPVCGVLKYKPATKTTDKIVMKYSVGHPANYANYSFGLVKGVNSVALPPPTSGPVTLALMSLNVTATVDSLLGPCTVAGYAESVYVATTIQNGWGRQSQYDASALIAFVLTP